MFGSFYGYCSPDPPTGGVSCGEEAAGFCCVASVVSESMTDGCTASAGGSLSTGMTRI